MQETQIWSLGWEDPLEKGMGQPNPVFLPWEFHGRRSLLGYRPWSDRDRLDWMIHTFTFICFWGTPFNPLWWPYLSFFFLFIFFDYLFFFLLSGNYIDFKSYIPNVCSEYLMLLKYIFSSSQKENDSVVFCHTECGYCEQHSILGVEIACNWELVRLNFYFLLLHNLLIKKKKNLRFVLFLFSCFRHKLHTKLTCFWVRWHQWTPNSSCVWISEAWIHKSIPECCL